MLASTRTASASNPTERWVIFQFPGWASFTLPLTPSTIRGMLRNRLYTGRVEFEGELIRARHAAIVSDVLFERCCR